jgi:heme-degrading monooxygenase HmoA
MNYEILEGKESNFESMFAKVIGALREASGHTDSQLYKRVDNPQMYLIVSEWNDADAYNEFISSDKFKAVTTFGKENILAARPQHRVYGDT